VDYEINPEPSTDEREAIVAAIEQLLRRDPTPTAYRSRWRHVAVRENIDDDDQATARPRSRPGATRA
jgi:hypothetical protein